MIFSPVGARVNVIVYLYVYNLSLVSIAVGTATHAQSRTIWPGSVPIEADSINYFLADTL